MPITVAWDNESKTIIRIDRTQPWSWADFDRGVDESYALMCSVDHPVYTINVISPDDKLPPGPPLPHIMRIAQLRPPNAGPTLVVGAKDAQMDSNFSSVIFSVARRVSQKVDEALINVKSLDEAYALIAEFQRAESGQDADEDSEN